LNAETVMERPGDMRMLKEIIGAVSDFKNFRVPDASKAAHYSCEWGAREDGMLLVGIHRHGYGAWVQIRDDPDLGLKEKFFLEEHRVDKKEERNKGDEKVAKAPGAVHLVRRSDYLLSVLKAKYSDNQAAKRAVENHHRNNKKHERNGHRRNDTRGSVSASPAPQARKVHRQPEHSHDRDRDRAHSHGHNHSDKGDHRRPSGEGSKLDLKRKHSGADDDRHHHSKHRKSENGHVKPKNGQDSMLKVIFRPIKESLKRIQSATKTNIKSQKERAAVMKNELVTIGQFIDGLNPDDVQDKEEAQSLRGEFWSYVATFWPLDPPPPAKQLDRMYLKIINPENEGSSGSAATAATNGTTAPPTSAVKSMPTAAV